MESPPHAVFHDKYQSYKYEKIQQGDMLKKGGNGGAKKMGGAFYLFLFILHLALSDQGHCFGLLYI